MPKLYRFEITKAALEALPLRERAILLGGGKILNELNIGTKHLMFCSNAVRASKPGPDRSAAFATLSFFLRVLAGHVFEANNYLRNVARVNELQKSKSRHLNVEFYKNVQILNGYFGRQNVIREMRNKFSFHTDPDLMQKSFHALPTGFAYEVLLGQQRAGDNIFYGSEATIIDGVQHLTPGVTWDEAINSIFKDTTHIAFVMAKIFQSLIGSILEDYLNLTVDDSEVVDGTDGPSLESVVVPFFCLRPDTETIPRRDGMKPTKRKSPARGAEPRRREVGR